MECLKNYIGIAGCDAPAYAYTIETVLQSASGLFINIDLPLSLKQIDALADSEQITFLKVWDEVQDRAIRKFIIRVKAGYKELFGLCDIDDDWFCENRLLLALPLLYMEGSELMFERMYTDRINRYTTIEKSKAVELRIEFNDSFTEELKSALELINVDSNQEGGDIFSFVTVLP